jgi:hypothetical protein
MDPSIMWIWIAFFLCAATTISIISVCITFRYSDYLKQTLTRWADSKVEIAKINASAMIEKAKLENEYWRVLTSETNQVKEKDKNDKHAA